MTNPVYIRGLGAVSPAGWGVSALRTCLENGQPPPVTGFTGERSYRAKGVPAPCPRPTILAHPRLRRSSSISQFAAAVAAEAMTEAGCQPADVGIVFSTMCGSVRYTQRFYAEARLDPSTASPILFPETVFNAPASHVAAALSASVPTYTLVGDSTVFLQALALGAQWISDRFVKVSLVIAAEELDWSVAEGWRLFSRDTVLAEGAAAVCLSSNPGARPAPTLAGITDPISFAATGGPLPAAQVLREQCPPPEHGEVLVDGRSGLPRADRIEDRLWSTWPGPRLSPKALLGEAMSASVGWQCIAALDHLRTSPAPKAQVIAIGCNHQAIAARFDGPAA